MTKPSALQPSLFTSDLSRCHCTHPAAHSPHTNCWFCLVIAQACRFPAGRCFSISLSTVVAGVTKRTGLVYLEFAAWFASGCIPDSKWGIIEHVVLMSYSHVKCLFKTCPFNSLDEGAGSFKKLNKY